MILTKAEIRTILDHLSYETVAEWDRGNSKVIRKKMGYSTDKEIGPLQAKLSMMLEAART